MHIKTPIRKVVVESPFAGEFEKNVKYARACIRDCINKGELPIASHLLYTQTGVLDDNNPLERALGIEMGLLWAEEADVTIVYTDLGISSGMKEGIRRATQKSRPIEYRSLGNNWESEFEKIVSTNQNHPFVLKKIGM